MTFQEFRAAVKALAAGDYCSARVEVTDYVDGTTGVEWQAYSQRATWTAPHATPEAALAEMRSLLDVHDATEADVAAIGEVA